VTVAIITDSTSDIPPQMAAERGITVVPLNVHFGLENYTDGVTLQADDFYRRLQSGGTFPTTSAPSAGTFIEAYRNAAKSADAILSVHLSSKVSVTHNAALQAKQEMGTGGPRVEVIDTLQASMGLGLVVLAVADAVKAGMGCDEAVQLTKSLSRRARFFGLLDTLEYLQKGGRIGRAQAYLGGLLKIKPILGLVDGVAHPIDRARTWQKGYARLKEIAGESAPVTALSVLYSTDRDLASQLAADLKPIAPASGVVTARFGPVLGTYLGPRSVGVALIGPPEA
jgi:DegV family protein with EDD domain